MRVIVLYRPDSEHARRVEEYIADFQRFYPDSKLEAHNIDTIGGSRLAQLYGVMEHPAIVATANDGQLQQMWQGVDRLPLMNDLIYFAKQ